MINKKNLKLSKEIAQDLIKFFEKKCEINSIFGRVRMALITWVSEFVFDGQWTASVLLV